MNNREQRRRFNRRCHVVGRVSDAAGLVGSLIWLGVGICFNCSLALVFGVITLLTYWRTKG